MGESASTERCAGDRENSIPSFALAQPIDTAHARNAGKSRVQLQNRFDTGFLHDSQQSLAELRPIFKWYAVAAEMEHDAKIGEL